MHDAVCVAFLQEYLPRLGLRWPGFRKVRRQVCKRIARRIDALGLADLAAYRRYLDATPDEWPVLDSLCRISISRFWRDHAVFERLRDVVLPQLAEQAARRDPPLVRCWSAGCASGEEPYSLSLIWHLEVAKRFDSVVCAITATDSDRTLLTRALRACYPAGCLKHLLADWRCQAFTESGGDLCLRARFRQGVEFRHQDIRKQMPDGPFDLILCRNLAFTYFDAAGQAAIARELGQRLAPGGQLVLGMHERLPDTAIGFEATDTHLPFYRCTEQKVPASDAALGRLPTKTVA